MDTSPLAIYLFGQPVERSLRRACCSALAARQEGLVLPKDYRGPAAFPRPDSGGAAGRPWRIRLDQFFHGKAFRKISRGTLRGLALAHLWYVLVVAILLLVYRSVDPPLTVLMAYRSAVDGWKLAPQKNIRLAKVPALARRMVVSVEDGKFYSHHGVDFEAILYARQVNKQVGRPLYGGSTLSMQTARTLFLVPFKSYLRKYLELIATIELELILSKERILEIYLSWAEWGRGVFGVEAAARRYYGKGLWQLDIDQTARLVALLSSPIRYNPETLQRNGILRSRYQYLFRKYGAPKEG